MNILINLQKREDYREIRLCFKIMYRSPSEYRPVCYVDVLCFALTAT